MDKTQERRIYRNVEEAAKITGTPLDVLLNARTHPDAPRGTNGFHESSRVYWATPEQGENTLEKWINDHRQQLESTDGETREHWLTRKDRANALLSELELEERYKRVVDKQVIHELLERITTAQVSLFNSRLRQELPARLNLPADKIGEIDKILQELYEVLQKGIEKWK